MEDINKDEVKKEENPQTEIPQADAPESTEVKAEFETVSSGTGVESAKVEETEFIEEEVKPQTQMAGIGDIANVKVEGIHDDFDVEDDFNIQSVVDEKMEDITALSIDKNHIIFSKAEATPFIRVAGIYSKLGNDVYSRSLYVHRVDESKVELAYDNGLIHIRNTVNTVVNEKQILTPYVVDLNSMSKVFTFGNAQIPIVEDGKNLYVYMYGGNVFVETHNVNTDKYTDYKVPSVLKKEVSVNGEQFIKILKSLSILVSTGSRAEERAIYFDDNNAYVYSGVVKGVFPGVFTDMTLQMVEIQAILMLFADVTEEINIAVHESHIRFSYGGKDLVVPKKNMQISDQIKATKVNVEDGVKVDAVTIYDVVNVLDYMPNNSGVLTLEKREYGFDIISPTRSGSEKSNSIFPIQATMIGTGVKSSVRVSLKSLKTYMRAFTGTISLGVEGEKLMIESEMGSVVVSGRGTTAKS